MTITFRKFTSNQRLSQETTAYATDVLWKGKPLGHCRNDGNGGMGVLHYAEKATREMVEEAKAWVVSQHYPDFDGSPMLDSQGRTMTFDHIEDYCDFLAAQTAEEKALRREVARSMKTHILMTDPSQGPGIFTIRQAFDPKLLPAIAKRHPTAQVLNTLPMEEVLEIFRQDTIRQELQQRGAPARPSRPGP